MKKSLGKLFPIMDDVDFSATRIVALFESEYNRVYFYELRTMGIEMVVVNHYENPAWTAVEAGFLM
jgi:hypothetical protein